MADLEQKRRTVRVLELLSESFEAHGRGDDEAFRRALDEALELDAFAVAGIRGGLAIGEIPNPERDWPLWVEYVQAARDALAAAGREDGPLAVSVFAWCRGCERGTGSVPCGRCGGPACAGCGRCPPCDGDITEENDG